MTETGWLIKLRNAFMYWTGPHFTEARRWTADPNNAIRFARKQDAELVMSVLSYHSIAQATEQQWHNGPISDFAPPERTVVVKQRPGFIWIPGMWTRAADEWRWHDGYYESVHHVGADPSNGGLYACACGARWMSLEQMEAHKTLVGG